MINTHGHKDHLGGNGEVKAAAPQVEIALHQADVHLAAGPQAHLDSRSDTSYLLRLLGRDDLVAEYEVVLRRIVGRSAGVDHELVDGDTVDLGQEVRLSVVHTPGHTDGSVCFFWEAEGLVFTGDAVQGHGWRPGLAPVYHDAAYLSSIARLEALGASTLCMGHAFGSSAVLNDPVLRGPEVATTLQSSRLAATAVDRAAARALALLGPAAGFPALAEAAFRELVYDLAIVWDRRTIVPAAAAGAIRAHLAAHGWPGG